MTIKNIYIIITFSLCFLIARTNTWGLDITAQAQNNSGEMIGISDYIRIKMQEAEPFEDCGIDRCCDKFEDGYGGCLSNENENYIQGDDPNGDNFNPITDTGYEKNGKWDGDIFNDSNQDCIRGYDDNNQLEAFIDRVGIIGSNFGPDGSYTLGERFYNLNENGEIDETLDAIYPECRYEEGGTDGWRQGEDEFDIPAPMDGHTNIRFSHLEWMNQTDINGNTCCMEGIFFSVDKKSWKNYDEVAQWDIYGNTWQLSGIDRIKFSWDNNALDSLFWIDDNNVQNPYEVYIFADDNIAGGDGKFNSEDTYVNMNSSQYFAVDPEFLISNGEGAKISVVVGECALEGTDEYIYDNDGDGWPNSNCVDCPKEFCPGTFTGDYYAICQDEFCIEDPTNQLYIDCPEETFTKQRIYNVRSLNIDIENNNFSNQDTSYAGGDGLIDAFLSVCKYNEEVRYTELDQIRDNFISSGNEEFLFLDHDCTINDNGLPEECQAFFNGLDENNDSLNYYINTNAWVQKWYKIDDIQEQDTNDAIYCETNAVDDCNQCATTDINNDGIYEDFNIDVDCTGECFGNAIIDECGKCQTNLLNANLNSIYNHFITGPDVDCNGECLYGTPKYAEKHSNGDTQYGMASINSCGICSGGNTLHNQLVEIDECGVCPAIQFSEPFHDANNNNIWDNNEEYLDLINDNIFTEINTDYFYGQDCWEDINMDGEWTDEDSYTDVNNNGQWDPGEPVQDPNGDGYTPAEPLKLPGECSQIDLNYEYNDGPNCDGACFNANYSIYSQSFLDDCSECSCLNGTIDNEDNFCTINHLPNSGDSEPQGSFEYHNSCIDSIFYNGYDNNGQQINSIQNFTALSDPAENNSEIDKVILEWEYNPELYIPQIRFKILKYIEDSDSWSELEPIVSNATCEDDGDGDDYGLCNSNLNECLLSNYGNDCNIIHTVNNTFEGLYSLKALDIYDNESEILAEAEAKEFYKITLELYNGNNLISFSAMPTDRSLSSIFYPIQDYVTGIIGPGVASSHIGNGNWVGVITEINSIMGYWLKIDNYDDINEDGLNNDVLEFEITEAYPVESNQIYYLQSGANLISYIGEDNSLINAVINQQDSKYFKSIIGEGVAASHQDLNNDGIPEYWVGNLETLNKQKGYWVILDLDNCITDGENPECSLDNFGNAILEFIWE